MTSSRPSRKSSRKSSPFGRHVRESPASPVEASKRPVTKRTLLDEWVEPPVRPPAPSFEDYRGVERQGVLVQMAPLGQMPPVTKSHKAKAKADGPKRVLTFKRAEAAVAAARSEAATPEMSSTPTTMTSSRRPSESRTTRGESALETINSGASESRSRGATQQTPGSTSTARAVSGQPSPLNSNSPKADAPYAPHTVAAKMRLVVEAAVSRAVQLKAPALGSALKNFYEESFADPQKAQTLAAILNHTANPQQNAQFQQYMKESRRQIRDRVPGGSAGRRTGSAVPTAGPASNASSSHSTPEPTQSRSRQAGSSRVSKKIRSSTRTKLPPPRGATSTSRQAKEGSGDRGESESTPNTSGVTAQDTFVNKTAAAFTLETRNSKAKMTPKKDDSDALRVRSTSETSSLSSIVPSSSDALSSSSGAEAEPRKDNKVTGSVGVNGHGGYASTTDVTNTKSNHHRSTHPSSPHSVLSQLPNLNPTQHHHQHRQGPTMSTEASPTTTVPPKLHHFATTKSTPIPTKPPGAPSPFLAFSSETSKKLSDAAASLFGSATNVTANANNSTGRRPYDDKRTTTRDHRAKVHVGETSSRKPKKRKSSAAELDLAVDEEEEGDEGEEDEGDPEDGRRRANKRMKFRRDDFAGVPVEPSHIRLSPTDRNWEPRNRSIIASRAATIAEAGVAEAQPFFRMDSTRPSRLRNGSVKMLASAMQVDEPESPTPSVTATDLPPPPEFALHDDPSRLGTPTAVLGRPSKKMKKTARVKMSPLKKSGVIAGIGRSGPRLDSPIGPGTMGNRLEDDNEDFCSACSGTGDILCCDGCDRSFHFTCLDEPVSRDPLPETWFCYKCLARRDLVAKHPRGVFGNLLNELEKKNCSSFRLPAQIRNYFEGVKTGEEGEYEEIIKLKPKGRSGWEEATDFRKLKDNKGNAMLCFRCGKSALTRQDILPCDFCSLHWHLDCVDPPMANPPHRAPNGRQLNAWMCPNHAENELLGRDPALPIQSRSFLRGNLKYQVRRPKHAKIVDVALRRGFRNNGLIEIENDASDEEGFEENEGVDGRVYRVPEHGIKLDFITKVKKARMQGDAQARPRATAADGDKQRAEDISARRMEMKLDQRPFLEQKLALNLVQLARGRDDLDLGIDEVGNLLDMLIAEAPSDVTDLLSGAAPKSTASRPSVGSAINPPSPPSSDSRPDQAEQIAGDEDRERKILRMLQELICRKLEGRP